MGELEKTRRLSLRIVELYRIFFGENTSKRVVTSQFRTIAIDKSSQILVANGPNHRHLDFDGKGYLVGTFCMQIHRFKMNHFQGRPMNRFFLLSLGCLCALSGCAQMGSLSPLHSIERSAIFHPTPLPTDFEIPENIPIEQVTFKSSDGVRIHGLHAFHETPKAIALFCHGNAGNVADRIQSLSMLCQQHQISVLMFDYRGFGNSEGRPSETGILRDARAARKWLAKKYSVDESEIILMGRSLGGGVAVDLASKDGTKALVLASTFPSLPDVAKHHFKLLPTKVLMTQRLDSINKIKNYTGPLLQTHGTSDRLIPISMAKQLFDAAPGQKKFIEVPGGHNAVQTEAYRVALDDLIRRLNE